MAFCLAFYRLIRTLITQRLIEATASDETQFVRGTAWITVGLKLGEIETIIGFATNAYWIAMARRIVRLLARASLIIGLIKGLDTTGNFTALEDEPTESISAIRHRSFRRSRLQESVSHSRLSTLRPFGPTAFHSPAHLPLSPLPERELLASENSAQVVESLNSGRRGLVDGLNKERVTVRLENGTPRLHMRFSALEIPKFLIPIANPTYTATGVAQTPRSSTPRPAAFPFHPDPSDLSSPSNVLSPELMPNTWPNSTQGTTSTNDVLLSRESPKVYPRSPKETSSESSYITTPRGSPVDSYTSLSTVRELAAQFPPLPTRVLESNEQFVVNNGTAVDFRDDSPSVSPRASVGTPVSSREFVATPFTTGQKYSKATTSTTIRYLGVNAQDSIATTPTSTALTDEPSVDLAHVGNSTKPRSFGKDTSGVVAPTRDPVDWIGFLGSCPPPVSEKTGEGKGRQLQQSGSTESLRISWLHNPEEPQLAQAVNVKSQVARIKSIGRAPIRATPRPIKNGHRRDSLHIERIQIPSNEDAYNMELVQGSLSPSDD
ncbi:hypothetical protein C0993_006042 [Termitomyces sp. T159_Od127]|nr:hypothetical protein C0993_006042 [Termitomyces sp. T159_Od127]